MMMMRKKIKNSFHLSPLSEKINSNNFTRKKISNKNKKKQKQKIPCLVNMHLLFFLKNYYYIILFIPSKM